MTTEQANALLLECESFISIDDEIDELFSDNQTFELADDWLSWYSVE